VRIAARPEPLFEALAAFHLANPGIEIVLSEDRSDHLVEHVRDGSADLALIGAAGELPDGVSGQIVISEHLVAAVPSTHPLASPAQVNLDELVSYPIVGMPAGTGVRAVFDQACAEGSPRFPSLGERPARNRDGPLLSANAAAVR
jgi:DNA-binding transcriptional LysR family regulator